jgi:hypothetical protein
MVGIRFGGGRDELLTFMQYLGVITPPYLILEIVSGLQHIVVGSFHSATIFIGEECNFH